MNSMVQRGKHKWRTSRDQSNGANPEHMLDILLALDRMVVEVSMQLYNVERRDRSKMRLQNRRLHAVVREHIPRLFKRSRNQSRS
jgi:hypothetical protein